tara:strand:- start:4175 stop:4948 length:774 start_codon:yes stop_codon:yes gene_type:complete
MSPSIPLQFMKYKSLILAVFTGVLTIPTSAQDKPKVKPQRVEPQVRPAFGALLARPAIPPRGVPLNLTEQQEQQIATLRKDHSTAIRELVQNRELDPQDRRDQMRDLSVDLQEAIKAVYTPDQRAKLAKAEQEAAKRREEMQKLRIVLSDEQKAKVRELSAKRMDALKQVRELPQEERQAAYMKASNEYREQYDKILTKEQKEKQKKLRELQGNRPNARILPLPRGGERQPLRIQPFPGKGQPRQVQPRQVQPRKKD